MSQQYKFGLVDYLVLAAVLILCLILGIIPACTGGKQKTTAEYLVGNRKLSLLPVAVSLSVSYVSSIAMLGLPAESYFYSIHYMLFSIGPAIGALTAAFTIVPVLYEMQTSSINNFLHKRYSSTLVKYFGTALTLLGGLLFTGVTIVGPSVFIGTVSDLPVWASVVMMGALSTLYTCIGGIKAVVWTDGLQALIILTGLFIVLIKGTLDTGSLQRTWELYAQGGRINFDLMPSPLKHVDVWSVTIAQSALWWMNYGITQLAVQRYTAMPSLSKAKGCVLMQIPCAILFYTSAVLMGVVAYGYYANLGCDPLASGQINTVNQIIPHMVMRIMALPGLPGLFFTGLFAGSLSNVSSQLVAMSYIFWEDILTDIFKEMEEIRKTFIIKGLVFTAGAVSTGLSFVMLTFKGTLLQMAFSMLAVTLVPMGVMFILSAAWPYANGRAAFFSGLLAGVLLAWFSAGAQLSKAERQPRSSTVSTIGCPNGTFDIGVMNGTITTVTYGITSENSGLLVVNTTHEDDHLIPDYNSDDASWTEIYKMSTLWYCLVGLTFGGLCGVLLSAIPGCRHKGKLDERYVFPHLRQVFKSKLFKATTKDLEGDAVRDYMLYEEKALVTSL